YWNRPGNDEAQAWIAGELESWGYTVEYHAYTYQGVAKTSVYATKVGVARPDQMYIVSAHMDSINLQTNNQDVAPGADDDGSGTSLVLELARVFAGDDVETETSVRFVLWNNEETGLNGSSAYVNDRVGLQGQENPPNSGLYPEPTWLGVIQHDMLMFDHGLPPQANQIPGADVD
ncbi:MAG: M20/M25/M40 family metallo-hydrolase, partial [Planctomycetes bacterium]|nr:M20/M25/M40 family metallo-hydrolase [Planctomycetota bacterium]